ncbi:MAG: CoA-binding protein [Tuberibacillus sp.]
MTVKNPSNEEIMDILNTKKRIAVVGLSSDPSKASNEVAKYLLDHGYEIIPVNPSLDEVFGIKAVPTLKDIEGHVDIVNVFRRPEFLLEVAKEAEAIGADVYWAQLGLEDQEAYDYLKSKGITTVMNQCIKIEHMNLIG